MDTTDATTPEPTTPEPTTPEPTTPEHSDGPVVLAYDGSGDAQRAVGWAVQISQQLGSPLTVMSAFDDADVLLADAGLAVAEAGGRAPTLTPFLDQPVEALVELSRSARLLVLGARGHSRVGGSLLGSVSQHVARHAHCPVAVVREQASPTARRVVVGCDGSPGSQPALAAAFELAQARRTDLVVMYGWAPEYGERAKGRLPVSDHVVDHAEAGERILAEAIEPWRARYPDVEVVAEAVPVHAARMLADASVHAGVVVVGSRGRGAFAGLLLGSVSQSVLTHAHCPVVVAR